MTEGSVMVDEGSNIPMSDDSTSDVDESQNLNNDQPDDDQATDIQDGEENDGNGETQYTDKGTKLDPNPQSAVHQELANARKTMKQMEAVLTNPDLLRRYAQQNGISLAEAKADLKGEKDAAQDIVEEFTPDQFKTTEDIARTFNTINKTVKELREENARLREGYQGISSSRELERVANTMQKDITTVQEKYPELNPNSSEYDSELENSIGELYHELDFDQAKQVFRGKVSILSIADRIMKAAGRGRKQGSQKAQTDVKVKQAGKVVSGKGKPQGGSTEGLTIAQKVAKAYGNG